MYGRWWQGMASSLFLALPLELREQIYDIVLQARRPFARPWSQAFFASDPESPAYGERPVAYLSTDQSGAGYQIRCNIELAQSCRQIRIELQSYLRTAPVDIVVDVENFAYDQTISFLQSLPVRALQRFKVDPESSSELTRKLKIQLTGPFDDYWVLNLTCWLSTVEHLLGPKDELATEYKLGPNDRCDDRWNRAPPHIVAALYQMHQNQQSGPVKDELYKIMLTFWGRYRVEDGLYHTLVYTMGNLAWLGSVDG